MLKGLKKNEKGIVFITVLLIIIVMMVLTLSLVSINISQVMITEREIKRLQTEILGMGALSFMLASQQTSTPTNFVTYARELDGVSFNVLANLDASVLGPYNTSTLNITVTYQ